MSPVKTVKHSTAIFSQNVLNLKTKLQVGATFHFRNENIITSGVSSSDEWLRLWSRPIAAVHSSDSILLFYILPSLVAWQHEERGRGRVMIIGLSIAGVATRRQGEAIVVAHRLHQTVSNRRCVLFRQLLICWLCVLQRIELKLRMTRYVQQGLHIPNCILSNNNYLLFSSELVCNTGRFICTVTDEEVEVDAARKPQITGMNHWRLWMRMWQMEQMVIRFESMN